MGHRRNKLLKLLVFLALIFTVALALPIGLMVLGWQAAGWRGLLVALAVVVGLGWLAVWLVRRGVAWLMMTPFRMKGNVLRGAELIVHEVKPIQPPKGLRPMAGAEGPGAWYRLDVTIAPDAPDPGAKGFTLWQPEDLALLPADAKPTLDEMEDSETYVVYQYRIEQEGEFVDDEGDKHFGKQRLRLYIGVPAEAERVTLIYYFTKLGVVELRNQSGSIGADSHRDATS